MQHGRLWIHKDLTDKNGSDRISVPSNAGTDDGHGQAKSVDDNVIAVIDEEDVHSRVTTEQEAVDTQRTFAED
jgi:hypothetical protein